jgi:hypothetical protein
VVLVHPSGNLAVWYALDELESWLEVALMRSCSYI